MTEQRSSELRAYYEGEGVAGHYAGGRWQGSAHARRTHRKEMRLLVGMLDHVGPMDSVMDVPCGAGRFAPLLAARCRRLISFDVAHPMLKQAVPAFGALASAGALPLEDESMDLSFCFRLLHHYPGTADRSALLQELARVSRRWVLVSYFDAASFQAWRHRVRRRKTVRFAEPNSLFDREAASAGLVVRKRGWVARGISEQVLALLEKVE